MCQLSNRQCVKADIKSAPFQSLRNSIVTEAKGFIMERSTKTTLGPEGIY
jgi:hypothetical protein